ncbi:MAG TPA: hypothetical protein VH079_02175 [Terriglobales bacterium]|nr:hypothetical protein [Terriglobales bacterium]
MGINIQKEIAAMLLDRHEAKRVAHVQRRQAKADHERFVIEVGKLTDDIAFATNAPPGSPRNTALLIELLQRRTQAREEEQEEEEYARMRRGQW